MLSHKPYVEDLRDLWGGAMAGVGEGFGADAAQAIEQLGEGGAGEGPLGGLNGLPH